MLSNEIITSTFLFFPFLLFLSLASFSTFFIASKISSFERRNFPFNATRLPFLLLRRRFSSSSFSRNSLRVRIASVSRLSAKSIKSLIRVLNGVGIFSSFVVRSTILRKLIAVGVLGDVLSRRTREAARVSVKFELFGEGVLGGGSRVESRISGLKG